MAQLFTQRDTDINQWQRDLTGTAQARAAAILAAAKTQTPRAQTLLGQILLTGDGIAKDPHLAVTWFEIAAAQGDAMAFNMLGRCYEHGLGLAQNLCVAASYYQKAAVLGLDWGQYNFANLLATGRGIAQDQAQAFALYLKAAEQGHAKSMNLVGRFYEDGISVTPCMQTAIEWYRRSAEGGDFRGQYSLATVLLAQGDIPGACHWLNAALAGGNLNFLRTQRSALYHVQHPAIRAIAVKFYAKAAELGDASDALELHQLKA